MVFHDTHRERPVFHSIQYKNGCLAASDLFHMFTQLIKFYTFHLSQQMLEKCDSSDRQWEWMVAPFSKFTGKFGLVFVLTLENVLS